MTTMNRYYLAASSVDRSKKLFRKVSLNSDSDEDISREIEEIKRETD